MSAPSTATTLTSAAENVRNLNRGLDIFLTERTSLFRIAYRVVGDVCTAEDVVQEAWLRWQGADRRRIRNPAAFLTTTTTRLAINVIQSARHRREALVDSPIVDLIDPTQDPTISTEQAESIEQTVALLMSRLSSSELTAYLLRKGFDYPYGDLAVLLGTSVGNARQLVRRAQGRLETGDRRTVLADTHRQLDAAFVTAACSGDLEDLERVLTDQRHRPTTSVA